MTFGALHLDLMCVQANIHFVTMTTLAWCQGIAVFEDPRFPTMHVFLRDLPRSSVDEIKFLEDSQRGQEPETSCRIWCVNTDVPYETLAIDALTWSKGPYLAYTKLVHCE